MTNEQLKSIRAEIHNDVFVPHFIKAAQNLGIAINSDEDVDNLLRVAATVQSQEERRVSQPNNLLKVAAHGRNAGHVDLRTMAAREASRFLGL